VNGLYTIQISDIPKLVEENKFREQDKSLSFTQYTLITLSVLVFLLLMFWLFRLSRKLKQSESIVETLQATQEIVTKEQIEKFIVDNLAVSSIKSITDHFKLSTQQLYELVKPEKPGSIIQKHRMEMVRKMRQEQKPVKEIAAATGLSVSYIRQLKTDDAG
jgi:AraC-like DNA-binding protein